MATLSGNTYEVFVAEGKRWIIDSSHETRSRGLEAAEDLLAEADHDGVRVVAVNERTGEEEIVFEEAIDRADAVVKIVAINDAPICQTIADMYGFEARRTAGRLLRKLLDDRGMTALEMAFNQGQLMMFERNDKLFGPALQRIGGIQARVAGDAKPTARVDKLHRFFGEIKERAKKAGDAAKYPALLKAKGLNALVESVDKWEPEENRNFTVLGALAAFLAGRGDWDGKLMLLINLTRDDPSPRAVAYVDEIAAEILDGAQAVMELLGGQPDAATANRTLVNLSCGRSQAPKKPISCIIELNDMLARLDMPLTSAVLLERVAREVGGVRPLTREGGEAERDAFVGLVRELPGIAGLMGGPGMSEAVVKRARIALSEGESDLTVEQAIDHLLDLLPNRAVRLGFLLDLAASALGERERVMVMQALERIAQQLSFLASLVPDGSKPEKVSEVVNGLKGRLEREGLPEDWRKKVARSLDELVARAKGGGKREAKGGTTKFNVDVGTKDMDDPTGERNSFDSGEMIFEEGDIGDVAYLIVDGRVEIFRTSGNNERVLATLGRGEIIGEMSMIDNQPRMASARALENTKVSMISRASLQRRLDRLEKTDRVLRRLIAVLVNRIRGQAQSPE